MESKINKTREHFTLIGLGKGAAIDSNFQQDFSIRSQNIESQLR